MLRSIFQKGPELKSPRELGLMREAGKIVAEALRLCRAMGRPRVRTIEIEVFDPSFGDDARDQNCESRVADRCVGWIPRLAGDL